MEKDNINFRTNNVDFARVFTTKCPVCGHTHTVKHYFAYETTTFEDSFFTSTRSSFRSEKLVRTEKINKGFRRLEVADISENSNETILIMICPNCGIVADYEACTKFEEEKIQK